MSEHTEQTTRFYRGQSDRRAGLLIDALLDCANQRDELVQACQAALSMLERMEIDFADDIAEGWGDEGADEMAGIIEYIRDALEKARPADGDE